MQHAKDEYIFTRQLIKDEVVLPHQFAANAGLDALDRESDFGPRNITIPITHKKNSIVFLMIVSKKTI